MAAVSCWALAKCASADNPRFDSLEHLLAVCNFPIDAFVGEYLAIATPAPETYNEVAMHIPNGCLLVALGSVVLTQSSQELRGRYGEPDLERFMARPGIGVTIQYGSDHLACQALIESPQPLIYTKEDVPFMSPEKVTDILEEIAPTDTRGKQIGSANSMMGCNESEITEYENVSISRSTHNCLPLMPEREMRATIAFIRDTCPKRRSIFSATPPQ